MTGAGEDPLSPLACGLTTNLLDAVFSEGGHYKGLADTELSGRASSMMCLHAYDSLGGLYRLQNAMHVLSVQAISDTLLKQWVEVGRERDGTRMAEQQQATVLACLWWTKTPTVGTRWNEERESQIRLWSLVMQR